METWICFHTLGTRNPNGRFEALFAAAGQTVKSAHSTKLNFMYARRDRAVIFHFDETGDNMNVRRVQRVFLHRTCAGN